MTNVTAIRYYFDGIVLPLTGRQPADKAFISYGNDNLPTCDYAADNEKKYILARMTAMALSMSHDVIYSP